MEPPNSGAESQTQPIQEIDGEGNGADTVKKKKKKKRGRPPRVQVKTKSPPAKMIKEEDEDVCFICFDGGSLVLCDRRGCPKAYHPACVKRDEAFFRSKAKWNCGWHICSICQKAAHHLCYTCTYSLCKGCMKKADYVCVRGDKGFCLVCIKTIMLIENGGQEKDEKAQVDFDDKTSWEYLFKVYWLYLKGKLSLTLDELTQAKNPCKEASTTTSVIPPTCVHSGVSDQKKNSSDTSPQNLESSESKRRKTDAEISIPQKETVDTKKPGADGRSSVIACKDWATKELLDFVSHMKSGDTSVLSQFDVQELMLEYIKRNNLRDPRKKSQIVCDSRLKILFGKPRVGHFEMLKLLEFHFFINEDLPKKTNKSIARQVDPDWNIDNMVTVGKDKKRRNHKKVEEHAPQNKLDEYAAIDIHNMNLIYLRRKLMENLIENSEELNGKVVGSIVRIRISGSDQKHGMYRLVQVVGTSKAAAPYKIGNKSADVMLEVLNLDKKETMSIDTISNQDLSEDECRRLRQSIRCGLVKRFTVGEIQDKAVSLQPARLNDLLEAETLRLNNLRDRASEKGHKKSLREYVEKLQLLKTPKERERRLRDILEVHSDPKMNPDYETDDAEDYFNNEHGEHTKPKYSGISRKSSSSFKKGKDFSNNVGSRSSKNEEGSTKAMGRINMKKDSHRSSSSGRLQNQVDYNGSTITSQNHNSASETSTSSYSLKNTSISNDRELEKIWHYRDPSGKIQGPFCMVQLQKWSTTGYFPQDMRIWRSREDESLLLNDVLNQQLHNKTATEKIGIRIKGLTVRTTKLSSTQHSINHEKLSDTDGSTGHSSVHKRIGNSNANTPFFGEPNMTELASPTPAENGAAIKKVSSVFDIANADLVDLPSPTPKEEPHEDEKDQNALDKEAGKGGAQLPKTTEVKREKWHSKGDHEDEKVQNAVDKEAEKGGVETAKVKCEEWYSEGSHEDEKVQSAIDKDAGKGVAQLLTTTEVKREEWHSEGSHEIEKVQNTVDKEAGKGGAQLPETTEVKCEERHSEGDYEDEKVQNVVDKEIEKGGVETTKVKREEWHSEGGHEDEKVQNVVNKEAGKDGAQVPETTEVKPEERHSEGGHEDEKVQNAVDKEVGKGGAQLLETMEVKHSEWHFEGGHIATTSANMEQKVIPISSSPPSLQPGYNYLPPWEGVRETIEFSTLEEESVSDLLAEVDAMESQNGYPSPTSRRNYFVDDLFDGPFEFSPTPEQGARTDAFNSNGAVIHLSFQPTTTSAATITTVGTCEGNSGNGFDSVKNSSDIHFKWPEIPQETIYKDKIDVNNSIKVDGQERETSASETSHDWAGGSNERKEGEHTEPTTTKSKDLVSELVLQFRTDHREAGDATLQSTKVDAVGPPPPSEPPPPPQSSQDHREAGEGTLQSSKIDAAGPPPSQSSQPLPPSVSRAIGSDEVRPQQGSMNNFGRPAQEIMTRAVTIGWDVHQRTYGGDRFNHHSPRERSYKVEDSGYSRNGKPWVRQSSFGSGGNGGSYPKAPPKGQRVCKFYESGCCKKGASCNYWHP